MTSQQPDYFGDRLTRQERAEQRARREQQAAQQALENKRLGVLIFQISWMMAFIALVMVNWQLRFQYATWPPPNVRAMGVALPTIATGLLLVGVVAARRARHAAAADDTARFSRLWWAAIATGIGFVGIMAYEWWHVGVVDVDNTQYQAVFRLMTGFHMLHAIVVIVIMANILHQPDDETFPPYNGEAAWGVEAASKLWDFVFAAWLLFYVVLYWWRSV